MNYRQPREGQLIDGERTRTQLPSTHLHFPSSGPELPSSGWYPGFKPYSHATFSKLSLITLQRRCLSALPYHFLPCVKALYEGILSPQLDCELFAGWDHVLFIFASPTASNIVPGSQRVPSTCLWDAWMNSRGRREERRSVYFELGIAVIHASEKPTVKVLLFLHTELTAADDNELSSLIFLTH